MFFLFLDRFEIPWKVDVRAWRGQARNTSDKPGGPGLHEELGMNIQTVPIERINPAPYNPRIDLNPDDERYRRIVRSLDTFGLVEPLVWNKRTGHLVGGHQRLKVLIARGASEAPVSVVDLPEKKEKALNLALNKVGGDWDQGLLADLLR